VKTFKPSIIAPLSLAMALAVSTGCAYHGTLRNGFYERGESPQKLPLNANLVCGESMERNEFVAQDVYFSHSVHIKTHPALSQALTEMCRAEFDRVSVTRSARNDGEAEIVLLPRFEMREEVLELTVVARSGNSGELLHEYRSAGNFVLSIPVGVHVMGGVNIAFCGLLSPIFTPAATSILGHKAEKVLEQRLATSLNQIAEDIRNDLSLVGKARASAPVETPDS